MSNNAPDYDDNLVFPPRHDKTAYELQIESNKLKEQLAEHKEYCCCAKNEVLLLEINRLRELFKKLKKRNCFDCRCGANCSLQEYSLPRKGCSHCVAALAEEALNGESERE